MNLLALTYVVPFLSLVLFLRHGPSDKGEAVS